jgi:hypothetical protein
MKCILAVLVLLLPLYAQTDVPDNIVPNYTPITATERGKWFVVSTVGPNSLFLSGPLSAAWGTLLNSPREYGPHWEGFGKRYGIRLSGTSVSNALEAGLGGLWGEDPRYFPSPNRPLGSRLKHLLKTTFAAPGRDGRYRPAYARFAGYAGSNFLSNTWRADSENGPDDAALRCVWSFAGHMASSAFTEFWPDIRRVFLAQRPRSSR